MVVFAKCKYSSLYYYTGQPVAWAISDKEDAVTLEAVWNVIHTRCPTATVSTLMIDDGNSY